MNTHSLLAMRRLFEGDHYYAQLTQGAAPTSIRGRLLNGVAVQRLLNNIGILSKYCIYLILILSLCPLKFSDMVCYLMEWNGTGPFNNPFKVRMYFLSILNLF